MNRRSFFSFLAGAPIAGLATLSEAKTDASDVNVVVSVDAEGFMKVKIDADVHAGSVETKRGFLGWWGKW